MTFVVSGTIECRGHARAPVSADRHTFLYSTSGHLLGTVYLHYNPEVTLQAANVQRPILHANYHIVFADQLIVTYYPPAEQKAVCIHVSP